MTSTHVFFTQICADSANRVTTNNQASAINSELEKLGYKTYYNIGRRSVFSSSSGIENTRVILVLVTQHYMQKVGDSNEFCATEFEFAFEQKGKDYMLPIIMEHRMQDSSKWSGPLGFVLSRKQAIDMSFDYLSEASLFESRMQELKQEIDTMLRTLNVPIPRAAQTTPTIQNPGVNIGVIIPGSGSGNEAHVNIGNVNLNFNYGAPVPATTTELTRSPPQFHPGTEVARPGPSILSPAPPLQAISNVPAPTTTRPGTSVPVVATPGSSRSPPPLPPRNVPVVPAARDFVINMFYSGERFRSVPHEQQRLDAILASSDVNNLYMVLEAAEYAACVGYINSAALQKIICVKQERGWSTVTPGVVERLGGFSVWHPAVGELVKQCKQLVSNTGNVEIVATTTTRWLLLVTKEQTFQFYFSHPNTTTCTNTTQCGFIVKVTPGTTGNPDTFNIQVVTDPAQYPAGIHYHSGVISAGDMHLVVEQYWESGKKWLNWCASWCGKPAYRKSGSVYWGIWHCKDSRIARLVVYYNNTS